MQENDRPREEMLRYRHFIVGRDGSLPNLELGNQETQTQRDLSELKILQGQFDGVLGRSYDREDTLVRSYNPVIDRWWIEKLRSKKDKEGEENYIQEIDTNLKTNLKERMQVGDNVAYYDIRDGNLYSVDFAEEPFKDVLQRGIEYRLLHGTPEAAREAGEKVGFEKVTKVLTDPDTEIGTRITSFSPRGQAEGTSYDRNIVDEYELIDDISGRYVKMTRRVVDFDETDYLSAAVGLSPNIFDDYDGRPIDAWMLSHPVMGSIPHLEDRQKGMLSKDFNERIYSDETIHKIIEIYKAEITRDEVDWKKVALSFNAFYNHADEVKRVAFETDGREKTVYISSEIVRHTINRLGYKEPERISGGGGCPPSKGYAINNRSSFLLGGSVASFAGGAGGESKEGFNCPKCGFNSKEPIGNQCPPVKGGCGLTKEQFALSGGKVC